MPGPDDLGPLSGREFDWAALVKRAWGRAWSKPDTAYEFSNGRKFEDTTQQGGSFYQPTEDD